jgi:hypothetical protein
MILVFPMSSHSHRVVNYGSVIEVPIEMTDHPAEQDDPQNDVQGR